MFFIDSEKTTNNDKHMSKQKYIFRELTVSYLEFLWSYQHVLKWN